MEYVLIIALSVFFITFCIIIFHLQKKNIGVAVTLVTMMLVVIAAIFFAGWVFGSQTNGIGENSISKLWSTTSPTPDSPEPTPPQTPPLSPTPPTAPDTEPILFDIKQIDTSAFPKLSLYFTALRQDGVPMLDLTKSAFTVYAGNHNNEPIKPESFTTGLLQSAMSVSLILDNSGSMSGTPLEQAKDSAKQFLNYVQFDKGDRVEIMEFNSNVYIRVPYIADSQVLTAAIDAMQSDGQTALYDALYMGLTRAYGQAGSKCILAFTDGEDNASTYSLQDVIELAQKTVTPIFLIGVDSVNEAQLRYLAEETGGQYFYAPTPAELSDIYQSVYQEQMELFALTYISQEIQSPTDWHSVTLTYDDGEFFGETSRDYVPSVEDTLPLNLLFSSVTASSVLPPWTEPSTGSQFHYLPYHAIDGNMNTIWSENVSGSGIDEWIQIDFVRPVKLSGMYIKNGYWRLPERLVQNNRLKRIRVEFSDGTSEEFSLYDTATWNYYELIWTQGERIEFSVPCETTYVRIVILEVYRGTTWDDTCLTGVELFR